MAARRSVSLALLSVTLGTTAFVFSATADDRLSALSSWRSGHLLHIGASTTDRTFDRCELLLSFTPPPTSISFRGVPVEIDFTQFVHTPLAPQHAANSLDDRGAGYKWTFDRRIPGSSVLPPGTPLYFQALLWSSTNANAKALTNGFDEISKVEGEGERRFIIEAWGGPTSAPETIIKLRAFDVDVGTVQSIPVFRTDRLMGGYRGTPQTSDDGQTTLLSISGDSGYDQILVIDQDDSTAPEGSSAAWLGDPHAPGFHYQGPARFRPGENDRFYVVEWADSGICSYTSMDRDAVLVSRSIIPPFAPLNATVLNDDVAGATTVKTIGWHWTFDGKGQSAVFSSHVRTNCQPSHFQMELFDIDVHGNAKHRSSFIPSLPAGAKNITDHQFMPLAGTHVLLNLYVAGGRSVYAIDTATGDVSAPWGSSESHVTRVAFDASYALIQSSLFPGMAYRVDGLQPFVGDGQPLSIGPNDAVTLPFSTIHGWFAPTNAGGMICQSNSGEPLQRLSPSGNGLAIDDFIDDEYGDAAWGNKRLARLTKFSDPMLQDGQGLHRRLDERNGIVVYIHDVYGPWLALLDTETMTWGPLAPVTAGADKFIF